MTDSSARNPRRKSIFWRLYLLAWLVLAGGAVGYLAVVAADPEKMAELEQQYLGNKAHQEQLGAQQRAEIERVAMTGELQGLRDDVRVLRGELVRLQTKVTEATKPQSQPKVAVAPPSVSSPVEPPQEVAGSVQQGTEVAAQTSPVKQPETSTVSETANIPEIKPVESKPTNSVNRFAPPLPVRGPVRGQDAKQIARSDSRQPPVVLNSGFASSPISTGSVVTPAQGTAVPPSKPAPAQPAAATQAAPITFGAAQITPSISVPESSSAVVVSAAPSLEGLRASWHQLASQHPALLGTLEPRYDAMGVNGPYRLLAGPLSDRSEADRLCSALRAYKVQCGVGDYVGNALLAN